MNSIKANAYYKAKPENDEFPEDVKIMNEEGYANVPQSTLRKWQFSIELSYESSQGISGSITAESLDEMKGGAGKIIAEWIINGEINET